MKNKEEIRNSLYAKERLTKLTIVCTLVGLVMVLGFIAIKNDLFEPATKIYEAPPVTTADNEAELKEAHAKEVIDQAMLIAAGYDFDKAIAYVKGDSAYRETLKLLQSVKDLEAMKETMVKWKDNRIISHLYFQPLIADTALAFDGDGNEKNYDQARTTVSEFKAVLQSLYDRSYVLVSTSDVVELLIDEEGNVKVKAKPIMLPEGKIPILLSEDDVCYHLHNAKDGFANRMILTENGEITCTMFDAKGNTVTGAFDLVPVLEEFIKDHPDFSYQGARAVLGITGFDGILGYVLDPVRNPNAESDKKTVAALIRKLRDLGYEIAYNGYEGSGLASCTVEEFQADYQKWKDEIAPVVGDSHIVIFPQGEDIGDWRYYSGERYNYLKEMGFYVFLNRNGSEPAWVQLLSGYFRQGRRTVNGQTLRKELAGAGALSDVIDAALVIDPQRPS